MTDIAPTVPLPEPAAAEFRALLSGAGVSGRLSLDALVNALPDVEFTPMAGSLRQETPVLSLPRSPQLTVSFAFDMPEVSSFVAQNGWLACRPERG